MVQNSDRIIKRMLMVVYISLSIATFYHSAWGFGTMSGAMPSDFWGLVGWWLLGGMIAIALDIGIGFIVWVRLGGKAQSLPMIMTLILLGVWSAYGQLLYSANHASAYLVGDVATWLQWLQYPLDARVLVNPIVLPLFAIIVAFIAKSNPDATSTPTNATSTPTNATSTPTNAKPTPTNATSTSPTPTNATHQPNSLQQNNKRTRSAKTRRAEVKRLSGDGLSNAEIARHLNIKPYQVTRDLQHG